MSIVGLVAARCGLRSRGQMQVPLELCSLATNRTQESYSKLGKKPNLCRSFTYYLLVVEWCFAFWRTLFCVLAEPVLRYKKPRMAVQNSGDGGTKAGVSEFLLTSKKPFAYKQKAVWL